MLISLVIDNYESEEYVGQAVESALAQTYTDLEVVVVDDGSRDGSREVLSRYSDRIELVLKENGGQASALNAGFRRTRGEVVMFLDGDDLLAPEAAAEVAAAYDSDISRYQWYLEIVDGAGRPTGERIPGRRAEDGDLEATTLAHGPRSYICPPTSGNAWSRSFLDEVMPLPEVRPTNADQYLTDTAPLFGRVLTLERVLGCFRVHGQNVHVARRQVTRASLQTVAAEDRVRVEFLAARARAAGKPVPSDLWAGTDWRMLLVRILLQRCGEEDARQRAGTLVRAALRTRPSLSRRLALAAFLVVARVLPRRVAFGVSRRILRLEYM